MGAAFLLPNSFATRHSRRQSRRFALACCASLASHLWLAHEVSVGAPRGGGGFPPLTVRLESAAEPRAALVALNEKADGARVRSVVPAATARKSASATPSRDLAHGNGSADTAGIAPSMDLEYYPARQLDVYPALLAPLAIVYPERASIENRAGRALVMVMIDAAGRVSDVAVVEADPPGYFEDAARKTFEQAAFSPARRNGMPVRSRVLIHVNFDPRAVDARTQ